MVSTAVQDPYARHVLARMSDFFADERTPWPRRLWDTGSVLVPEELWEAGHWQAHNVLSASACDRQRHELKAVLGRDAGLGDKDLRKEITNLLSKPLLDPSPERRRLKEVIGHLRPGHLDRWVTAIAVEEAKRVKPERFSRTVAAHLLDLGYSGLHLRNWVRGLKTARVTASDIAESAAELARARPQTFDVLVALDKVPHRELAEPLPNWLDRGKVGAWLRALRQRETRVLGRRQRLLPPR
ncbi:hypothetical protein [Streptomyces sp. NPDC006999]|uniref:hypothetical protein n=1 Tax=unclassified Streptomyces TaxID=2593676 RepID=UPI0033F74664